MTITEKLGLHGKITQKHSEDIEEIIQLEIKEAVQKEREKIINLFDRKMLKTKGENHDVASHRHGYNHRVLEEWEIIKIIKNK